MSVLANGVWPSPQYCANLFDVVFQRPATLMSFSFPPHRAAHLTKALRMEW